MILLITEDYRQQNAQLHENPNHHYGVAGKAYIPLLTNIYLDYECESILDYGCGKGSIARMCPTLPVTNYDPAIPEFADDPEPADLVICLDVMEHIEPECLWNVMAHIRARTRKVALISVSLRLAHKTLPDGRNAHLIVKEPEWWLPRFLEHWRIREFSRSDDSFYVVVHP
jgi:2-polyprenyl-3-methyl-5-hydroxy-6-metoxy-1,4-benzoquinol methylase